MKGHWMVVVFVGVMILGTLTFSAINAQGQYSIPSWVKGVAGFWAENKITDADFGEGLSFLISEEIIKVPEMKSLKQEVAQLKTENKNLRGDLEFLEKENSELRSNQGTIISTPTPTPSDPLDFYAKNNPIIRAMQNGEVRFYFNESPSYIPFSAREEFENAISDTTNLLETQSSSKVKLTRVYDKSSANVIIAWIKDFGGHRLGEAFPQYLNIGVGQTDCTNEWLAFDKQTLTQILMHEIGHSIGFNHSSDVNNVMSGAGTDFRFIDWRYFIHGNGFAVGGAVYEPDVMILCNGEYFIQVNSEKPVDVKLNNPKGIVQTDQAGNIIGFGYDTICGEEQTKNFEGTCVVSEGYARLNLSVSSQSPVFTEVKIDRLDNVPKKDMKWDESAFKYPAIYSNIFN